MRPRRSSHAAPTARWIGLFLFAALTALCLTAPDAAAQPHASRPRPLAQSLPPDARRDYDAGKLLFDDGDYATALLKYQAAYDQTHDPRLLWNVAVCQKNLRHYARAAATLGRYLAEGGDLLSPGDRHDAQDLSRAIAPFTVPTTIHVSEPGAQIWIDDALVGQSPLGGPVALDMGTRHLRVRKDGYRPFDGDFPVGGSAPTTIEPVLERQGGHLRLDVPPDATVLLDEKEVGRGPHLELDLPVGAHAMRVTAPRMRPLQSDVVVEDGESRTLELALEPLTAPVAEVHVTVICLGPDPVPQDKLLVFLDGSSESALPMGTRLRREPGNEVRAYVSYRVPPGRHLLHVSAQDCEDQDVRIDVPEGGVAEVKGSMAPSNHWLGSSPAGSPDGWRLTVGLIETSTSFSLYQNFAASNLGLGPLTAGTVGATMIGPTATLGLQGRWLTGLLDARFQVGRPTGTLTMPASIAGGATLNPGTTVSYNSTLSQWSVGARPGVRLPLYFAALSTGIGLYLGQYLYLPDSGSWRLGAYSSLSYWIALDAQPSCAFGFQVTWAASADDYGGTTSGVGNSGAISLWASATYTPNTMCTKRRGGLFKIEGTTL